MTARGVRVTRSKEFTVLRNYSRKSTPVAQKIRIETSASGLKKATLSFLGAMRLRSRRFAKESRKRHMTMAVEVDWNDDSGKSSCRK